MSSATVTDWRAAQDVPPRPKEADLLAFFGIPPDPRDRLEDNIRKKRQYWNAKTSGPAGRELAERIKAKIIEMERAILRGAAASGGGEQTSFDLDATIASLDDVWRVIQDLVFGDLFHAAMEQATAARRRWPESAIPHAVYGWVVAVATETGAFVSEQEAVLAVESCARALAIDPRDERSWTSKTFLLLYGGDFDAALATMDAAEHELGQLDASMHIARLVVHLHNDRFEEPLREAVLAVERAAGDSAVRSRCSVLLAKQLLPRLLPIDSPQRLAAYVEAVNVAAWCASGVPEAEDLVLSHRMWAQLASGTTFAGGWVLRSFLATLTGLITLPLSNAVSSRLVWQVFLEGPAKHRDTWFLLGTKEFVQEVHAPILQRLPWQWPALEEPAVGDG